MRRRLLIKKNICRSIPTFSGSDYANWKAYGDIENYSPGKYHIKTYNKISQKGLSLFDTNSYEVHNSDTYDTDNINVQAILLRSHKLQVEEVGSSVCAIARCGSGTNNIPVAEMTELGIPVFNTPGANANAVKELALCGMFLGSRRIHDGTNHMKDLGRQGLAKERVEKDKSMFGGREIRGKRLSVLGLGQIGTILARDAYALGMDIVGFDPNLSVKSALALPHEIHLVDSIAAAVTNADYISINIPYIKGKGGTHGIINKDIIDNMKPSAVLLNFARGELIDSEAMLSFLDSGTGRYVTDFPDDLLWDHKNSIVLPHLGASTVEAEDQAASMAVDTIKDYLETGAIRNSVNFPTTSLPKPEDNSVRVTIVNKNLPGRLAQISESCANLNMNIIQQLNVSRGVIAYNVVDIDRNGQNNIQPFKRLQHKMLELDGVLSCRILFGI